MKHELTPIDKFKVNDAVMIKSVTNPSIQMDMRPYDKPCRVVTIDDNNNSYIKNAVGDIKEIHRAERIGVYKRKHFLWVVKYWKLQLNEDSI